MEVFEKQGYKKFPRLSVCCLRETVTTLNLYIACKQVE